MRWPTRLCPVKSPPSSRYDARQARQLREECEAFCRASLANAARGVTSDPCGCGPTFWRTAARRSCGAPASIPAARGAARASGAARAYLAGEVLTFAERCGSLEALQHGALVPLEFDLARAGGLERWSPAEWVATVVAALAAHRRRVLSP